MQLTGKTFQLKGKVQNYAWGGYEYIPQLLGFNNDKQQPCAEYWMGAHPSAPSVVSDPTNSATLYEIIQADPATALTEKVVSRFGELPYLFKILDVKDMLSIQVHPTKIEAEKGFDAEEAAKIPITAPHRNYKDRNHKPEVMVALSEFWLLHGFKQKDELMQTLIEVKEFNILKPLFKTGGFKGLYQLVMEMDQTYTDDLLTPLVKRELRRKRNNELTREEPGWWVAKLYEGETEIKHIDKGVFSIYFFNIVKVNPGEAVFQGAGVPHAYLEGQNVELMANSDNVLRGGLTPKHIDVQELMKHTLFEGIKPHVMKGVDVGNNAVHYPCPVPDFAIQKVELNGTSHESTSQSLEIIIVIEGGAVLNSSRSMALQKGDAFAVLPNEQYSIEASGKCILYKAYVPE